MLHLNQEGIFTKQSSVFPALGTDLDSFSQKKEEINIAIFFALFLFMTG